jgi:hypothetical protein
MTWIKCTFLLVKYQYNGFWQKYHRISLFIIHNLDTADTENCHCRFHSTMPRRLFCLWTVFCFGFYLYCVVCENILYIFFATFLLLLTSVVCLSRAIDHRVSPNNFFCCFCWSNNKNRKIPPVEWKAVATSPELAQFVSLLNVVCR